MAQPAVSIEIVQHGFRLVDCSQCGVVGVYVDRTCAALAKRHHVCGQPASTVGLVPSRLIVGGSPRGVSEPGRK